MIVFITFWCLMNTAADLELNFVQNLSGVHDHSNRSLSILYLYQDFFYPLILDIWDLVVKVHHRCFLIVKRRFLTNYYEQNQYLPLFEFVEHDLFVAL